METRESVARPFLFASRVLVFCLLLGIGCGAQGVEPAVSAELQQQEKQSDHSRPAGPDAATAPGLKKALVSKDPRRTDIPDALLIIMLALIGIVVIARRNVSGKDRKVLPIEDSER